MCQGPIGRELKDCLGASAWLCPTADMPTQSAVICHHPVHPYGPCVQQLIGLDTVLTCGLPLRLNSAALLQSVTTAAGTTAVPLQSPPKPESWVSVSALGIHSSTSFPSSVFSALYNHSVTYS